MIKEMKEVEILLVEDDKGDVKMTQYGLAAAKLLVNLSVVDDGEKAINFLRKASPYVDAPTPDLILLDLNLPKKDGREVLKEIKFDSNLKIIPVCVLTTSDSDFDILNCYEYGANCYITKPIKFEDFSKVIKALNEFWFTIVKIPSR
ncbi:MAG: response regulator [Nitrospirae bacterium]|nr:response regulator [Nitrospirota bacterium]